MIFSGLSTVAASAAPGPWASVELEGDVPEFEFPGIRTHLGSLWEMVKSELLIEASPGAPYFAFYPFDRAAEPGAWIEWQNAWIRKNPGIWLEWFEFKGGERPDSIDERWIDENISRIFPFPKTFIAFHYDGTNRIQMDPNRSFRSWYQTMPDGTRKDITGFGYYSAVHEMLHYGLEQKGMIETKLHHCIFVLRPDGAGPLIARAATRLVATGLASEIVLFRGVAGEEGFQPCDKLSEAERLRAIEYASKLAADRSQ